MASGNDGGASTAKAKHFRRVILTGQVGVDKKPFLAEIEAMAKEAGHDLQIANVGELMYAEAPDIVRGRILDLPRARLNSLRRSVFKDILKTAESEATTIVNTHATFRWKHGLFEAFDFDQMRALNADLYVTLVDNLDAVHERLAREHDLPHTFKDILVWREEEMLATEMLAHALRGHGCHYIVSRGYGRTTARTLYQLIFEPWRKKVYPSFPMTHVMNLPDVLAQIDAFRETLAEHLICFDPGDVDEKRMLFDAGAAIQRGETSFTQEINGRPVTFDARAVTSVASDIDGQIYARDFKLIDQSDMIVSFIPELPGGMPGLSSGVERELQHAFEGTKEVYVVWAPKPEPSPFITETATRIFPNIQELLSFFQKKGYIGDIQLRL